MTTSTPLARLKPLAGRALQSALNQLLALDPDSQAALRKLDGRRIALALEAPALALEISVSDGELQVGPVQGAEPDLGIRATLSGVLSQLPFLRASDAAPVGKVRINGDADLARSLQKLVGQFDPDWAQPFSDLFGPLLGPQIARAVRDALRSGARMAETFARDSVEFLTEESRDLLGKAELSAFHDEVDALRDDVERIAARVARLHTLTPPPAPERGA